MLCSSQLWDLTAGKLMHDFKYHDGQVQCLDFHPHEFLLATGIVIVILDLFSLCGLLKGLIVMRAF